MEQTTPAIAKTIKMFINGQFPRTESGRSYAVHVFESDKVYARCCLGSRKDLRGAVEAAQAAHKNWSHATAFLRSQILYRMAEMAESKRQEFTNAFLEVWGLGKKEASSSVDEMIATFVYYAGFADKYQQVSASINPVSGPFHNFTTPEPVGVVGLVAHESVSWAKLVDRICSIIVSGNSLVVILDRKLGALLAPMAEVLATSDLPAGVVNLISGDSEELYSHLAGHMEVHSICCLGMEAEQLKKVKILAIDNMKRVVEDVDRRHSLAGILDFTEFKTIWHPVGF